MQTWIKYAALTAGGAGLAAASYAWFGERADVALDRFTVAIDKPGLPDRGLRVLHLSDLHCRADGVMQGRKLARLQQLLAGEQYDLLALTGDLIHDEPGLDSALALIDGLRPRLGAFFCPGNHDYCESSVWGIFGATPRTPDGSPSTQQGLQRTWNKLSDAGHSLFDFGRRLLRNEVVHRPTGYHNIGAIEAKLVARGVQPLVNRATHLQHDGVDLWLAGVDDFWEGKPDLAGAVASVPPGAPLILLAHNPDVWLDPCVARADLVLSGHVHGGQVRLPGIGAVHTQGTHLSRQRPDGWFERGQTRLFVSRGVGESLPLRFGARPQAALIHIINS